MNLIILFFVFVSAGRRRHHRRQRTRFNHGKYLVCFLFKIYELFFSLLRPSGSVRALQIFFHRKSPKQVFFKVDDMLLSRRQFRNQSPSKNNQDQSNYFIESAYYWNKYWDSTQFKWSIPYQEHKNSVAQVSFG